LANLGNSYVNHGDLYNALTHFEEAVSLYDALGEDRDLALRMGIVGNLYGELGRQAEDQGIAEQYFNRALLYYDRTLNIARVLKDQQSEAELLRSMGNVLGGSQRYAEAMEFYRAAYPLYQQLGQTQQMQDIQQAVASIKAFV
jgi:tetratricopeptide (TPR) repeat protein